MDFKQIKYLIEQSVSYIDLYDVVTNIVDKDLRSKVEESISILENKGTKLQETKMYLIEDVLNVDNESDVYSLEDFKNSLQDISNDSNLSVWLEDMKQSKNIPTEVQEVIQQIVKNNRYRSLQDKKELLLKVLNKIKD